MDSRSKHTDFCLKLFVPLPIVKLHFEQFKPLACPTNRPCCSTTYSLKLGARNLVEFGSRPRNVVFDIFTGDGKDMVFTAYGDHYRKIRRIMTVPFFTNKVAQQYRNMWEEEMELVVKDLCMDYEGAGQAGVVIRRRLQLMLYNILYRMMFDCRFESMGGPMFIEATRFNSERSRLTQTFENNYGEFIPLLRPFLNGYLERCRELQSSRLKFFDNHYVEKRGTHV